MDGYDFERFHESNNDRKKKMAVSYDTKPHPSARCILVDRESLKNKLRTEHWTTFYEKWKVENQENTNMSRHLNVLPRWKKKKCDL